MRTEYCGQRQTHKKEVINCTKIIIAESFQSGQDRDSINKYMKREEKGEEEEEEEEEEKKEEEKKKRKRKKRMKMKKR